LLAAAFLLISLSAIAQSQSAIEEAFLHRTVWLKIDMPGTQLGVDIYPEKGDGLPRNYESLLSQYPAAYHQGDQATVTKVVFKKDHIEFQLDHGGFGQFGDNTDVSPVPFSPMPPSREEIDLRARIEHENDDRERWHEKRELEELEHRRLENDDRNRAAAQQATEAKIAFVNDARARGGSRFNISYNNRIPDGLTVDDVSRALGPYLSFNDNTDRRRGYEQQPQPPVYRQPRDERPRASYANIQKGMTFDDVHAATQSLPSRTTRKNTDYGTATIEEYPEGNNLLTVTYINGVVTQFVRTAR
jgi:hypothetical protein